MEYNTYILLYINAHSYIFKCNKNLGLIWKNKSFKMLKFAFYFTIQTLILPFKVALWCNIWL